MTRKNFLATALPVVIELDAICQGALAKREQVAAQTLSLILNTVCCGVFFSHAAQTSLSSSITVARFLTGLIWLIPTIKAPGAYGIGWMIFCILWYGGESLLYASGSWNSSLSLAVSGTATGIQFLLAAAIALRALR